MSEINSIEYEKHKEKCGKSFEDVFQKLDKMERAMFGEPDLQRKGVFEMTTEMYKSVMMAKGGERVFWISAKIAGGIIAISGAFWAIIEVLKKILK